MHKVLISIIQMHFVQFEHFYLLLQDKLCRSNNSSGWIKLPFSNFDSKGKTKNNKKKSNSHYFINYKINRQPKNYQTRIVNFRSEIQ